MAHVPPIRVEVSVDPAPLKNQALALLRMAATAEGDSHFDDHLIEFRDDGWTVQHPVAERIDGSLFDCQMARWDLGDIGHRGRFTLHRMPVTGALYIGSAVA